MSRSSGSAPRPRDRARLRIGDIFGQIPANHRTRLRSNPNSQWGRGRPVCNRAVHKHDRSGFLPNLLQTPFAASWCGADRTAARIVASMGGPSSRLLAVFLSTSRNRLESEQSDKTIAEWRQVTSSLRKRLARVFSMITLSTERSGKVRFGEFNACGSEFPCCLL